MNVNIKRLVVTDSTSTPLTYKLDFEEWLHEQNSVLTPWSNWNPARPFSGIGLQLYRDLFIVYIPLLDQKLQPFLYNIPIVVKFSC